MLYPIGVEMVRRGFDDELTIKVAISLQHFFRWNNRT
ncbi:Uncharacterised protein [Vibrio cholerae]|nr:Uncharacterised protein [Vibrio cholerae]